MLGIINRTIQNKTQEVMVCLYKALVRPHLEYCTVAWSPSYVKDRALLERVQHRFTRMVWGCEKIAYEDRLAKLGLWTLQERRNRADMVEVFRMYHGLSRLPFGRFFELCPSRRTRGHSLKLVKHRVRTDLRQHFFSERIVDSWNGLDETTVTTASLLSFKRGLTRMREKKMGLFTD